MYSRQRDREAWTHTRNQADMRRRELHADRKTVIQTKSRQSADMDELNFMQADEQSYSQTSEQSNRQTDAIRNLKNNRMLD
jgi:hypothetical protein